MRRIKSETSLHIRRLRRPELPTDTIELAKYLIGKTLVHDLPRVRLAGRIVETEAYPVGDAAGHAFGGLTPSRRSLFLPHGHAYVYFTYGSCFMMNVSSEGSGTGAGVLVRALEPLGRPFHAAAARHDSFARPRARPRTPRASDGHQQAI